MDDERSCHSIFFIKHAHFQLCFILCQLSSNCYFIYFNIDGLMQEKSNSIADALELRLSCTNP